MITNTQLNTPYTSLAQAVYTAEAIGDAVAVPAGCESIQANGLLAQSDAANGVNGAAFSLDTTSSPNPGPNDWTDLSEQWTGGTYTDKQGNTQTSYPGASTPNQGYTFVRTRVTPALALSIGGSVIFS